MLLFNVCIIFWRKKLKLIVYLKYQSLFFSQQIEFYVAYI